MPDGQPGNDGLGVAALSLDALGLLMEELVGDVIGIVLGQQLALLPFETREHAVAAVNLALAGGGQLGQVLLDGTPDTLLVMCAQANGAVVLLDSGLDSFDALVALRAGPALVQRADKVFVEATIAFVAGERQSVVAVVTENAALQGVGVLAVALTALVMGFQDGLHLLKQLLTNQLRMAAGIDLALVGNFPGIERVGQQLMDAGMTQWLGRIASVAARAQTLRSQQGHHVAN